MLIILIHPLSIDLDSSDQNTEFLYHDVCKPKHEATFKSYGLGRISNNIR